MTDFHFIEEIGAGIFGSVWLAEDTAMQSERAVKLVPLSEVHDPDEVFREARSLARLEHPNVVRVYGAGRRGDCLYISMEYVRRGTVGQATAVGFVPLRTARAYLIDICRGLTYMHREGFIHRDLKPSNVLVGEAGQAKISDFGLVTPLDASGHAAPFGYTLHLAPEVLDRARMSVASDIYALGVTAYRIVNGDHLLPPVDWGDEASISESIRAGNYPNRKLYQPFVPTRLRNVVNRAMSVNAQDRFETVDEFRRELEQCQIRRDWSHTIDVQGSVWRSDDGVRVWEVRVVNRTDGTWAIETRSSRVGKQLRKRSDFSFIGRGDAARVKRLRSVLSRLTEKESP